MLVYFLTLFLLFLHPIESGDFFHHLNSGKYVITQRELPYRDDLSFTASGQPWVAYAWGSGVIFYLLYRFFGPNAISVWFAMLGTTAALLVYLTLKTMNIPKLLRLALTFASAALASLRWPARPEVLGPLFVMGAMYMLLRFKRLNWLFPLYFWGWAILYGASAFMGVLLLLFFLVSQRAFDKKSITLFLLCISASLANGYGLRSFLYIFQIPKIATHVGEWLPLWRTQNPAFFDLTIFYQYIVILFIAYVVLYLILLVKALLSHRQALLNNLFTTGVSLVIFAPFYVNRFINVAALASSPFMGLVVSQLSPKLQKIGLVFLIIFSLVTSYVRFRNFPFGVGLLPYRFPTQIIAFFKRNNLAGNIYSTQEMGAFLSWELPQSKVFMDTRDDLYQPTGIFEELVKIDQGKVDISNFLEKYHTNIVLGDFVNPQTYKPLLYSPVWRLVYLTDGYFILVKKNLADTHSLKTLETIDPLRDPPAKPNSAPQAEKELTSLIASEPTALENQTRLISLKLALGKASEAVEIFERLPLNTSPFPYQPSMALANYELAGRVYLAAGLCDKAIDNLTKAEKLSYDQLIFFPSIRLPSAVDKFLGDYHATCATDLSKAREFYGKYLQATTNPIEKRQIEQKLRLLDNK